MNKQQLIEKMNTKLATPLSKKDAENFVNAFTDTIAEALAAREPVQLIGFGTFEVRDRAARIGNNPSTGEKINIPACKMPAFKAGKALKETVNK